MTWQQRRIAITILWHQAWASLKNMLRLLITR